MAAQDTYPAVQVVNVDLGGERQKLLREKLTDFFTAIAKRTRLKKRLIYTVNADESPLVKVLHMNEGADALFTGFQYDSGRSEDFKQQLTVETPEDLLQIDPRLRYPRIAEMLRLIEEGQFRHRKLFLVGDIHEKIGQYLRSGLPVWLTPYTDADHAQVGGPVQVTSIDRIDPDPDGVFAEGKPIPVGAIAALSVADIPFAGIVHMPEAGNRFEFRGPSIVDTARKLYAGEGLAAQLIREQAAEEKRAFVRGRKVFIVLDPDLEHVIAERFQFDKMEQLYRHQSLEDALKTLEGGQGQGIVEYFEREGYQLVFDVLDQSERDKVLIAVVAPRLSALLMKEIETVKGLVSHLEQGDLESLFYKLPEAVADSVLKRLQAKSYEKFLAVVPTKIRETVILDFLSKPERVKQAWQSIGNQAQQEILANQAAALHGIVFFLDSAYSKRKFPGLKFDFERSYNSGMRAKMGAEQQKAAFSTIVRSIEASGAPKGLLARSLKPVEIERFVVEYVARNAADFYNALNPAVRKQVWLTVGQTYRDQLTKNLHPLDKIEILQGSKEAAVGLVFADTGFLAHLKSGTDPELCADLFLMLKKLNKGESKSVLLKQVLTKAEWRPLRMKGVPALLTDPKNGLIYQKLAEHVEELEFRFDSLVCTKAHYEQLKELEPLREAVVTLVDDLVDPSLYNLFQTGKLTKEEYDGFSKSVEQQLADLRRQMAAKEAEDPVGVYLLETMQILHQLTSQASQGALDDQTVEALDERLAIRQRLVDSMKEHLGRIDDFLKKAEQQQPLLTKRMAELREMAAQQQVAAKKVQAAATTLANDFRKLQQAQSKAMSDRKKVALTQKELSVQFFEIIQPLILEKVKSLGGAFKSLMRMVGLGENDAEGQNTGGRVIFRFSDDEIEQILKYKIVFCAKDAMLAQFVATCLRIDKLEDTLFKLATADALPKKADIDILFYGPGYSVEDFADSVKQNRLVPFADEAFYERLKGNERLKARTKAVLTKADQQMSLIKPKLAQATQTLKAQQSKGRKVQESIAHLEGEQLKLRNNVRSQGERRLQFQGELDLLETRLAEVDSQFDTVRTRVTELMRGGDKEQATEALESSQADLTGRLRDELIGLNKQMARMLFIKDVKDAGETISRTTQNGILSRIEARETYAYAKRPFKKLIVADDGSNASQNLKRVFLHAAIPYFKLPEMGVQEISIKRLLALAESNAENGNGNAYPFVALFSQRPEDDYGELKLSVKKIRSLLPDTYQLLITPFGDLNDIEQASPLYRNLQALKDQCTLVNAASESMSEPAGMLRVLREKAPLS